MKEVYVIQGWNNDVGWVAISDLFYTHRPAAEDAMNKYVLPHHTKDTVRVYALTQATNPEVEEAKKILESITPEDINNVMKAFSASMYLMAGGVRDDWVEDARKAIDKTIKKLNSKRDIVRKPSPDMVWVDGNKPKAPPTNSSLQDLTSPDINEEDLPDPPLL